MASAAPSLPVLSIPLSDLRDRPFPPLQNDLILKIARGQNLQCTDRVPVWAHRQAGRYLPEFRSTRAMNDFFDVCRTPILAAEVTLQPIRRFDLDAAIIFSDILVVPQAMGLDVIMEKGKGPVFPQPLKTAQDFQRVKTAQETNAKHSLQYVYDALTLTRHSLKGRVPLLGFSGAPYTLFAYMVEGSGKKSYDHARKLMYTNPQECKHLLNEITEVIIEYLCCQIEAGAQMIELFDSWAGDLSPELFKEFVLPLVKHIASSIKRKHSDIPLTYFPKGAHFAYKWLNDTDFDVIAIDWACDLDQARLLMPSKTLQGNLDVAILFASKEKIEEETLKMAKIFGPQKWIANLGHGMLPDHTPEGLEAYVEAVHKISKEMLSRQQ